MGTSFSIDPRKIKQGAEKIFVASRKLARLTNLFKSVDLNIDEFINATDVNALKQKLNGNPALRAKFVALTKPAKATVVTNGGKDKSVFDRLSPQAQFAKQLFISAGIDLMAMVESKDPYALKKFIDMRRASGASTASIQAAAQSRVADIKAERERIEKKIEAETKVIKDGLAAVGISLPATFTAQQITNLLNERVAMRAKEMARTLGVPPDEEISARETGHELFGLARTKAAFKREAKAKSI